MEMSILFIYINCFLEPLQSSFLATYVPYVTREKSGLRSSPKLDFVTHPQYSTLKD